MARNPKAKAKTKAKKPKTPEPQEAVLEEVDTGGLGIDEGVLFATMVFLIGAVYMVWSLLDGRYPEPLG